MSAPVLQFRPDAGDGVHVDLPALLAGRLLIQGSSGAGKSFLTRYLLEQTHGRLQQFIIDPEGEFATLRERFDYVLASAGDDGDVPADPRSARLLCRRLVELGASAILDLYELEPAEREEFVGQFLKELINLPKDLWRTRLVVVDEAHEFAPQSPPKSHASVGQMRQLSSKGRKRGLGAVYLTQRLSKLDTSCAEAQNTLIGYTALDVDVKRAGDVLGFDKEGREGLRHLKKGEFFAFGPALARQVTKVRSGSVQTTHPQVGELAPPAPPAPAAIRALVEQLQDLPERAAEEEQTVEGLRADVARLERELRAARKGTPAVDREVVYQEGYNAARADILDERDRAMATIEAELGDHHGRIGELAGTIADAAAELRKLRVRIGLPGRDQLNQAFANRSLRKAAREAATARATPPQLTPPRKDDAAEAARDVGASGPQLRILETLARFAALGVHQVDRSTLAVLSGASPTSSSFANNLGHLRSQLGLIDYPAGGQVALTSAGQAAAPEAAPPSSLEELWAQWKSHLSGPQGQILDELVGVYPDDVTREDLAALIGASASSSSYANNLGRMRTLGIIDYPARGRVAATALLFPEGLR